MAQHDMVLDNNPGLAFRQDLNNAIAALVSASLGNTAPTTTYAGQEWIDTGTSIDTDGPWLRQRNSANTAWNRVRKVDTDQILLKVQQDQIAVTTSGTSPSFTISTKLTNSVAVAANQRFRVKFHAAGTTGSNTLARDGLTPYSLKQYDSTGAKVSAIVTSGLLADVEYDGTDYVILNPLPVSTSLLYSPVSVASASTVNLTGNLGKFVFITGTTQITAFTMTAGQQIDLIFNSSLTLSHNATTNNLPGAGDIITASGDRARYYYDGTTVYCLQYVRSDGTPVKGGLISSSVVSLAGTSTDINLSVTNAKRITICLNQMSTNGTSIPDIRLGTSSGFIASGYQDNGASIIGGTGAGATGHSQGFLLGNGGVSASSSITGTMVLVNMGNNTWLVQSAQFYQADSQVTFSAGGITLSGPLTRIRVTTINGTDTFDAGTISIIVES